MARTTVTDLRRGVTLLLAACAAIATLAAGRPAVACGFCHNDKVAVVFDQAAIDKAKKEGKTVLFLGVDGSVPDSLDTRLSLRSAAAALPHVDKSSIRTSSNPAAVSFAFAGSKTDPAALAAALGKRFASERWTFTVLRTMP